MNTAWISGRELNFPDLTVSNALLSDRAALAEALDRNDYLFFREVLDYDALEVSRPYLVDDLPGGAKRLMPTARGYTATVVAGQIVQRDGHETGARPGTVVRGGRTDA